MDWNEYTLEILVKDRLARARAHAAARALVPRREPIALRAWLGRRLIGLGQRLLDPKRPAGITRPETTHA